jgi:hypothetical protein
MFAPRNEIGVRELFAQCCQTLGYRILDSRRGFPDYELLDLQEQRLRAEAEFMSENFILHGHDVTACDLIICWQHTRAMQVPVLELASSQVYPPGCLPPPPAETQPKVTSRKALREASPAPPWVERREGYDTPRLGRDEMNLCEFPFSLIDRTVPPGQKTFQVQDTIRGRENQEVSRIWTVTGSDLWGLPTIIEEHVYVALMEVTRELDFQSRRVPITRYDLIQRMQWKRTGDSYHRLEQALKCLTGITIDAKNAFWDPEKKSYLSLTFGILDGVALQEEAGGRKSERSPLPQSWIEWNSILFANMQHGNLKFLDTGFYFSLDHYIAQRLYRYLDKKRYDGKRVYAISLYDLAFTHLGLKPLTPAYPSLLKQRLAPAHEELIQRGFLEEVRFRTGAEGEIVEYHFARQTKRSPSRPLSTALLPAPPQPMEEERKLIEELTNLGVTQAVARKLVREHPSEVIRRQLDYLPHRQADDPAALLVKAIVEDWAPPRISAGSPPEAAWRFCTTCHQAYQDGTDHESRCAGKNGGKSPCPAADIGASP